MGNESGEASGTGPRLMFDAVTGEWVSKNELKKRTQKRARKAAKKDHEEKSKTSHTETSMTEKAPDGDDDLTTEADAIFKHGFLADIYRERPSNPVVTHFPPEPNGYLHLGHVKAIATNFGFARYHGGKTILRFDDTNPDGEEEVYFAWILKLIKWLGFTPSAITYSSDNFQKLYELAQKSIKMDKAYVCHCTEAQIKLQRGGIDGKEGPRFRCEHAEQDSVTNLAKFQDMHDGKYEPQAAFLRMKQEIKSGNPQMWDLAAYRIPKNQTPHVRAPEWKIFPTYDFTHGLCDSFEGITHSLCTTEFNLSRESYEWLNKTLGVYEPMQREFGRLNLSGTVMSKRALKKLVEEGLVRGWDDPRLYTLIGLRRRGVPPGALLSFVNELGVTTSRTITPVARFEQSVRRYLETTVPRLMMVLDPIPVTITSIAETTEMEIPYYPKDASFGSHWIRLTRTVYIDRLDFREEDSKGYYRLAPGKTVGLMHLSYPIKVVSYTNDEDTGLVSGIEACYDKESKPKAYIHWVPEGSVKAEVRVHDALFKSDDPMAAEGGFLNDVNSESEKIYPNALIERCIDEVKRKAPWPVTAGEEDASGPESVRFQAMRVGYFAMDSDSTEDKAVLNRVVSLKEDSGKKS